MRSGKPDHRPGRRKVEAARQDFADELEEEQEEEAADHLAFVAASARRGQCRRVGPAGRGCEDGSSQAFAEAEDFPCHTLVQEALETGSGLGSNRAGFNDLWEISDAEG